jgi:hypothetical protein
VIFDRLSSKKLDFTKNGVFVSFRSLLVVFFGGVQFFEESREESVGV